VLALYYSRTVAVCLHVLQALTVVPAHMSCMLMMALMSGTFKTCTRTLGAGEPCCTGRPARFFFMLEARGPQRTIGHVTAQSPPSRVAGSGAVGYVELCRLPVGPEPRYTRRHRSPPWLRGGSQSCWTRGSLRAHFSWEAGFGAAGHVATCRCTLRSAPCLDLKLVPRGT
jgi:hypothetical protein